MFTIGVSGISRSFRPLAIAALLLAGPQAAVAADLYRGSIKDEPLPVAFTWTGFYVGGHAGLVTGDTEGQVPGAPFTATDYELDGALYGGHVGYNYQIGQAVVGIEGTYSGADIEGDTTCVIFLRCQREMDWLATVVGRAGYASGRWLVYGFGGVAWADLDTDVSFLGFTLVQGGETHVGWTAGFGVEHAITDAITARIEYAHVDFDEERHTLTGVFGPIPDDVEADIDTIRLGVSLKLTN